MVPANIMLARVGAFQTRKEHWLIDRDLDKALRKMGLEGIRISRRW